MGARRFTSLIIAWVCLVAGCVLFCSALAQADELHVFAGSFGSEGSGSGELLEPSAVAVNGTTHDVYVVDHGNNRVEEFSFNSSTKAYEYLREFNGSGAPTGVFSEPTQIAVDNSGEPFTDPSAGDVYVLDLGHHVIDKFSEEGVYIGQLSMFSSEARGLAVDPHGFLWVDTIEGQIDSFSPAVVNEYLSERMPEFGSGGYPKIFAVDSADDLYIGEFGNRIEKLDSSGKRLLYPLGSQESLSGIAVDSTAGDAYIDYEGSVGEYSLDGAPVERFGTGDLTAGVGLAVDASDGSVYVADASADKVVVFGAVTQLKVGIGVVTEQQPRSLTLNGTVNPKGAPVTSCVFEYGTTSSYGQRVPCSPAPGSGTSPVAVSAHLSGLTPGTEYHYRLVAENAGGEPSATADRQLIAGPVLGSEFVTNVASSSATLQTSIDPNGDDTNFYLQYGTTTSYGTDLPSGPPGVDLGSAVGVQKISLHLQTLDASTVYHYRFVVVQGGETFAAPDGTFTTQSASPASALPDGRVWELVSPPDKDGALIEPAEGYGTQIQAAADGSGITYIKSGPHVGEDPEGNLTWAQVLSKRRQEGWATTDLALPTALPEDGEQAAWLAVNGSSEYPLFSTDLSLAAVEPLEFGTPLLSPEATERTLYLRDDASGIFSPLVSAANVPPGRKLEEERSAQVKAGNSGSQWPMHFVAATPDLSHVILKTPMALTENAIDEETLENVRVGEGLIQWNLYEWSARKLQLVNVLPDNEAAHGRAHPAAVKLAGMIDRGGLPGGSVQRAMSNDGRRVAWTVGEPYNGAAEGYGGLFVRDMVEEKTVEVGRIGAVFQTMNSDGSRIFYLENGDLYEFDWNTGTSTDLTGAHGPGETSANVQEQVSDVSEDGSYVYFVAKGVLASGAVAGEENLYLAHDTSSGWSITSVATLSGEDEPSWFYEGFYSVPDLSKISSRVSPDGRFLAFMSERSLTGYDNLDAVSGQPDEEVYLYDAQADKLVCASCDPTGARPVGLLDKTTPTPPLVDRNPIWSENGSEGGRKKSTNHWLAGSIPGWDYLGGALATYQPRYLSDSGRLFFNSPVALVPQDTNGLEDVYEYEPVGVGGTGGCTEASSIFSGRSGGCVGLISGGTSSAESVFYDASENGDDVFFDTAGKLVGEDYDKGNDVYDAHVCSTMVPCKPVPVSSPPCTSGDSCKAAPTPQPEIFGPAPSATFKGVGNVTASAKPVVGSKSLTRAQRLSRALRACRKDKRKGRADCEVKARKRYAAKQSRKTRTTGKAGQ
jgi:hypothetical protein